MDKNMLLAIGLSMLVIFGYTLVFPPQPPVENVSKDGNVVTDTTISPSTDYKAPADITSAAPSDNSAVAASGDVSAAPMKSLPERNIELNNNSFRAIISTKGGHLTSFRLNDYDYSVKYNKPLYKYPMELFTGKSAFEPAYEPGRKVEMVSPEIADKIKPFYLSVDKAESEIFFELVGEPVENDNGVKAVKLRGISENGLEIFREFIFRPDSFIIESKTSVSNKSENTLPLEAKVTIGSSNEAVPENDRVLQKLGIVYTDDAIDTFDGDDISSSPINFSTFDWGGVMSLYFLTSAKQPDKDWSLKFSTVNEDLFGKKYDAPSAFLVKTPSILGPGETVSFSTNMYVGPKKTDLMEIFDPNMVETLGMHFKFLSLPMLEILRWLHDNVGNWGIAIILLTLGVRILILPIAYKGIKSMKRMGKMTPKIQKLKEKHKDNKEKLNKEIMELYRKNKINPVGGCLPMVLQIPIFLALYSSLLPAIELRHQPFIFWINDLSQQDYLMVLPALCGLFMFLQQKLTPTMATMDPMQEKIMKLFPIMLSVFFIFSPAGLVLYWTVSGIVSIAQQYLFNRLFKNL